MARSLGVSAGTVAAAVGRARARALTWEAVEALSDDALERLLFGPPAAEVGGRSRREPDLAWVHQELRRPGVTLELLHVEYLAAHPTGYRLTQEFVDLRYRRQARKESSPLPTSAASRGVPDVVRAKPSRAARIRIAITGSTASTVLRRAPGTVGARY